MNNQAQDVKLYAEVVDVVGVTSMPQYFWLAKFPWPPRLANMAQLLVDDHVLSPEGADFQGFCLQVQVAAEQVRLANARVQPDCALALEANQISQQHMSTASSLADILRRPHIHYRCLCPLFTV